MNGRKAMAKISVLVADDNAPIREMLTIALGRQFDVIGCVENGRQLVDAVLTREPDVVVSDVWMPVLNGVEALHILRDYGRTTPFVLVSADSEVAPHCLKAGAARFVCKVDLERELAPAVHAAVHSRNWDSRTHADGDLRSRESLRPQPRE
ncbi:MAG: response regulator [Acidobacteria bacterium]|nr:MAG: response regulator [Acidobacteriota bacterium]